MRKRTTAMLAGMLATIAMADPNTLRSDGRPETHYSPVTKRPARHKTTAKAAKAKKRKAVKAARKRNR